MHPELGTVDDVRDLAAACREVGALLVVAVAFIPIFTLVDQEGRLFTPLAWWKNLASGTFLGHPLHPLLVTVPIGSWTAARARPLDNRLCD